MVTTLAVPLPVDPPEVIIPKTGLIAIAKSLGRLTEDTEHQEWEIGGLTYKPIASGPGAQARSVVTNDDTGYGTDTFVLPSGHKIRNFVTSYPFIIRAAEGPISSFGWTPENYEDRAKARLEALQSKVAEQEFWTGEVAQIDALDPAIYDWLAKDDADNGAVDITPSGGAVSPRVGLSMLEAALAKTSNGVGTIHVTKDVAMLMPDRWNEGPIVVWPDSSVVVGTGYTGVGPDGTAAADGESWVYATDPVSVRLGPVELWPDTLAEALDRAKNNVTFVAERYATVSWDGNSHYAIRVMTTS